MWGRGSAERNGTREGWPRSPPSRRSLASPRSSRPLRQRLLAVRHALLDFAHHVGAFGRVVFVFDAGGELVLLLLHELQDLFERRLALPPRHVGASAAGALVFACAAGAFAVLQVQAGDAVVVQIG